MPPAPTAPANAPEPISKVKDASTPEVAALKHVAGLRRDALPALLSRFHRDLSRKHPKIREALGHTTYTIGAAMQGDTELGEANAYIAKFIDTCLDGESAHVAAFRQRYEGDPRLLYDGVYLMEQIAKLYQITHGSAEAKIAKKEFKNAVFFTMGMDLAKTRENGLRLIKQFESVPGLFTGPIDTWHAIIDKMPSVRAQGRPEEPQARDRPLAGRALSAAVDQPRGAHRQHRAPASGPRERGARS